MNDTSTIERDVLRLYGRRRMRAVRAGTWEGLQDPAPVIAHIAYLRDNGMSARSIAAAAGVALSTAAAFAWPDRHSETRTTGIQAATARALLAVSLADTPSHGLVLSVGSVRRIRALARMGWNSRTVAAEAGVNPGSIRGIDSRIRKSTADAVAEAYDRLSMRQGPHRKAATTARNLGWPPPLAWDDDTIDDPAATPYVAETERESSIPDNVEWLLSLTPLATAEQIADRLGVSRSGVQKALRRHGRDDLADVLRRNAEIAA